MSPAGKRPARPTGRAGSPAGRTTRRGTGAGSPRQEARRGSGSPRGGGRRAQATPGRRPPSARAVALDVLGRIDDEGAYANLALSGALDRAGLSPADRRFATDLVYGTTRLRRACDHLADRFLARPVDPAVRNALRLGVYQLVFAGVARHAAVGETVEVAPRPARGLVNAVLRRVADAPVAWPDDATRLSVPDWVLDELTASLGRDRALAALATMNEPATVSARDDGYVQDPASQAVAAAVGAEPGERVLDLCAAPGGKATALAGAGAHVVAADLRRGRARLVRDNATRVDAAGRVAVVVADGTRPPWPDASFDRVLVDAPCSGLGTLRRRADLRWRVEADAVERLADLQRRLVAAAADLVRPGGVLVYSVCTLTAAESTGIDDWLAIERPDLVPDAPVGEPWDAWGRGAIVLPQTAGTDGMCMFRYVRADTMADDAAGTATRTVTTDDAARAATRSAGDDPAGEES
ncbi:MAG TPA: transcription antitermination factor NusB [Acidimicrobiales bacterium]|nr:transcription antitermination factor NusB [Acidimicrobiales bacterium]